MNRPEPQTNVSGAVRLGLLAGATTIVAFLAGLALTNGTVRVVAAAAVAVAVLTFLILRSFEGFILALLVIRTSLDLVKGDTGGTTASDVTSLVAIGFLVVFAAWYLVQTLGDPAGHRYRVRTQGGIILALLASVAISVISSQDIAESLIWLVRLSSAFLMFFAVDRLLRMGTSPTRVITAIFGAAVVPLGYVLYGLATGNERLELKEGLLRLRSTFAQSNPFSHFLVLVLVFGIALWPVLRGWRRWAMSAILVVGLYSLVETQTRSAWFGFGMAVLVLAWMRSKPLLLALLVGMVVVAVSVPTVQDRIGNLFEDSGQRRSENSLEWRVGVWEESLELAQENPLTGIGIGITPQRTSVAKPPHNDYLRAYAEMGVVGLGAFVVFIGSMIATGWRARKAAATPLETAIGAGFFAYSLAFAGASVGENLLTQVVVLWYVMAFLALARWVIDHPRPPIEALVDPPVAAQTG